MMDEQLIEEVAHHGVIYNRQKYYLNGSGGGSGAGKYETKDEAWQIIAMKLRTDVETCKKRWKYLRERYVSQRKQGDPPVYEHLSRPYLEKMKFLDQHIQPRKSYRNVPNFLTSPHSANSSNYSEYNMDSKSNGSMKNMGHFGNAQHHYQHQQSEQQHAMNALSSAAAAASALENANGLVKIEADQVFRDFAAAVASQQLQQISQSQMHHHHQGPHVTAAMADTSQNYQEHFRNSEAGVGMTTVNNSAQNGVGNGAGIASSSSSMKSPLSSPLASVNGAPNGAGTISHSTSTPLHAAASSTNQMSTTHDYSDANNDDLNSSTSNNYNMKKPRVQLNTHTTNSTGNTNNMLHHNNTGNTHFMDDTDDDSDDNSSSILQPQTILNDQDSHFNAAAVASTSSAAAMQQLALQHFNKFQVPQNPPPQRSSEHLLGELVTTELLKMSKDRRKNVQKRILEILFFDD